MSKLPSMQWYPGDWRKDPGIQSLGYFERGVWFEMLNLMFESEERGVLILNGRPMGEDALARLLGLDKQILTTTLTTLLDYGVARRRETDQAIYNKRMVEDQKLRNIRAQAGKLGGNPLLLNQKSTTQVKQHATTGVKQIPTPSSSSSSSSSSSNKEETYIYTLPNFVPVGFLPTLRAWDRLQREKYRRSVSQVEVDALLMAWDGRLDELMAAMVHSTANGWKNIRANVPDVAPTNGHQKDGVILSRRESQQEKQVRIAREGLIQIQKEMEDEENEQRRNAQNLGS